MITAEGTVPFPMTDPQAVAAFGNNCATLVQALHGASTQLTSATTAAAAAWQGDASLAFQEHMATETAAVTKLADQLARVQPVIATYAGKMTAAENNYNSAVRQQMAAIAEGGAAGFADEALAIAQEGVALVELEAAGVICAGALAGITGSITGSSLMGLLPKLTLNDAIEHGADMFAELAERMHTEVNTLTREVSGYVKKSGTVVEDYVRYAGGVAKKYGTEISAGTLREAGELAEKAGKVAGVVGNVVTVLETKEKYEELVKQGVPEPAAALEALASRVAPTLAGSFAGGFVTGLTETEGVAEGAAVGTVVEPGGGTVVGAVAGAVIAAAPSVAAGAVADLTVTKATQAIADPLVDKINEMLYDIKPEGPKETVPPPAAPGRPD